MSPAATVLLTAVRLTADDGSERYGYARAVAVGGHLWVAGSTSVVDGAVARARGGSSVFGAVLDSSLDRVADALLGPRAAPIDRGTPPGPENGTPAPRTDGA